MTNMLKVWEAAREGGPKCGVLAEKSGIGRESNLTLFTACSFLMAHSTSEHYINQRFTKALSIVEQLPASSSFQPTKEEKLRVS